MQLGEMIERLRARDEKALDWLIQQYRPLICYIITPILVNDHDREECISEVVMRVWDGIDSFNSARGSWNAWLTALARNTALNKARTGPFRPIHRTPVRRRRNNFCVTSASRR